MIANVCKCLNMMGGVRVVLDLALFFEDRRKKSYFFVNFFQNNVIRDVVHGIKSYFGIINDIVLELNGCYVHENIDVRVLNNEDIIKVLDESKGNGSDLKYCSQNEESMEHVAAEKITTVTSKKKRKMKNEDMKEDNEEVIHSSKSKKKKKTRSSDVKDESGNCKSNFQEIGKPVIEEVNVSELWNGVETSEHEPHSSNKRNVIDASVQNGDTVLHVEHTDFPFLNPNMSEKCEDTKASRIATEVLEVGNCSNETLDDKFPHVQTRVLDPDLFVTKSVNVSEVDLSVNNLYSSVNNLQESKVENDNKESKKSQDDSFKKRRRRRRKRTPKDIDSTSDHNYSVQSFNVSSLLVNGLKDRPKHIKFVDEDVDAGGDSNDCECDNSSGNNEANGNILTEPVVKSTSKHLDNVSCWKSEDGFQSKRESSLAAVSSLSVDNSELICNSMIPKGNSTPLIFECKKTVRSSNSHSLKNDNEINFSKYPVLRDCAKVNDIIAFKKWKMDTNYCPGISSYISAKVLKISQEAGTINLRILNGHTEFKEPTGKFSLMTEDNEEDVEPEETVPNDVHMNIKDLFDIRLIFP